MLPPMRMPVSSGSPPQRATHLFYLCQSDEWERFLIVVVICISTEKIEGIGENSNFISTITINTSDSTLVPSNSHLCDRTLKNVYIPQLKTVPFM